jgi:CheY-like chemotaxis protein
VLRRRAMTALTNSEDPLWWLDRLSQDLETVIAGMDLLIPGARGVMLPTELKRLSSAAESATRLVRQMRGSDEADEPEASTASTLTLEGVAFGAGRPEVLLVDDDEDLRTITAKALERRGFAVRGARDGMVALQVLSRYVPMVVLLDVAMPRMDGLEALGCIRLKWPDLPVVMWSGSLDAELEASLRKLGAVEVLMKPVCVASVASALRSAVAQAATVAPRGEMDPC